MSIPRYYINKLSSYDSTLKSRLKIEALIRKYTIEQAWLNRGISKFSIDSMIHLARQQNEVSLQARLHLINMRRKL